MCAMDMLGGVCRRLVQPCTGVERTPLAPYPPDTYSLHHSAHRRRKSKVVPVHAQGAQGRDGKQRWIYDRETFLLSLLPQPSLVPYFLWT